MAALYAALAAILVAAVSGRVTWMISRREKSGRIDTSEAARLWDEGTAMRLELRSEVSSLRAQLDEAVTEIRKARREAEASRQEALECRLEAKDLMLKLKELQGEVRVNNEHHHAENERFLAKEKDEGIHGKE